MSLTLRGPPSFTRILLDWRASSSNFLWQLLWSKSHTMARSSGERRRGVVAQTEERDARSSGERRRGVVAQTRRPLRRVLQSHPLLFTQSCSALLLASSLGPRLASCVGHGSLGQFNKEREETHFYHTFARTKNDTCDRAHVSDEHAHL